MSATLVLATRVDPIAHAAQAVDLLRCLQDRSPSALTTIQASFREDADLRAWAIAAAAPLPEGSEPYSRRLLHSSAAGEIMVANWRRDSACAPHDHGESYGAVLVLAGEFHEQAYLLGRGLEAVGAECRAGELDCLPVVPGEIHRMRSPIGGITLHFYAPAIQGMNVYDEANGFIYTVDDSCGAWIPGDERLILKRARLDRYPLHNHLS